MTPAHLDRRIARRKPVHFLTDIDWIATKVDPYKVMGPASEADISGMGLDDATVESILARRQQVSAIEKELQNQEILRIDWDISGQNTPSSIDIDDPAVRQLASEDWESAGPEVTWNDLTPEEQNAHIEFVRNDGGMCGSSGSHSSRSFWISPGVRRSTSSSMSNSDRGSSLPRGGAPPVLIILLILL